MYEMLGKAVCGEVCEAKKPPTECCVGILFRGEETLWQTCDQAVIFLFRKLPVNEKKISSQKHIEITFQHNPYIYFI